jgi:hypothetical protein
MIHVAVEIREHALVRRVRVTAQSIERALELCEGNGRVVFPIVPEQDFVPKDATGASEPHTRLAA